MRDRWKIDPAPPAGKTAPDHEQAERIAKRILAEDYIAEQFAQPLARAYLDLAAQLAETQDRAERAEGDLARERPFVAAYREARAQLADRLCPCCGKPLSCIACSARSRRGTGPIMTAIISALEQGVERPIDLQRHVKRSHGQVSVSLQRLMRYGIVERVGRGRYKLAATHSDSEERG